jgi:hypothetical protein
MAAAASLKLMSWLHVWHHCPLFSIPGSGHHDSWHLLLLSVLLGRALASTSQSPAGTLSICTIFFTAFISSCCRT